MPLPEKPVPVLGKDGVSTYPSTIISGTSVTDSVGRQVRRAEGWLPVPGGEAGRLPPQSGDPRGLPRAFRRERGEPRRPCRVRLTRSRRLPSAASSTIAKTGILQLDVPLDPVSTKLLLQKSVSAPTAAVGDIIQFTLTLENTSTTLAAEGVSILDLMPQGFRYVKGSAQARRRGARRSGHLGPPASSSPSMWARVAASALRDPDLCGGTHRCHAADHGGQHAQAYRERPRRSRTWRPRAWKCRATSCRTSTP